MPSAHSSQDGQAGLNVGRRELTQWPLLFSLSIYLCAIVLSDLREPEICQIKLSCCFSRTPPGQPCPPHTNSSILPSLLAELICSAPGSLSRSGSRGFFGTSNWQQRWKSGRKGGASELPLPQLFLNHRIFHQKKAEKLYRKLAKQTKASQRKESKWVFSSRKHRCDKLTQHPDVHRAP